MVNSGCPGGNYLDRSEKVPRFAQKIVEVLDPPSDFSEPTWRRVFACPNLHE